MLVVVAVEVVSCVFVMVDEVTDVEVVTAVLVVTDVTVLVTAQKYVRVKCSIRQYFNAHCMKVCIYM